MRKSTVLGMQAPRSSPLGFACELCLVEYFDGGHTNKVNLAHEQSERGAADILPWGSWGSRKYQPWHQHQQVPSKSCPRHFSL